MREVSDIITELFGEISIVWTFSLIKAKYGFKGTQN